MEQIFASLIPISVCVVLPVTIVWLTMRTAQNETNRKTEVMLKALETGATLDPSFFRNTKKAKGIKERLLGRLTAACVTLLIGISALIGGIVICNHTTWNLAETPFPLFAAFGSILTAVGLALLFTFFVGKKMLAKEIAAEEKEATDRK